MKVKLYARFRDVLGDTLEIPSFQSVSQIREYIARLLKEKGLEDVPILIAVNGNYADDSREISEHDEIVIFPPVSGG